MDRVIILIQAVKLTLVAVLKWTFSKLPANNVGRNGVGVAGDYRGQVATGRRNAPEIECIISSWYVLIFNWMFLNSFTNIKHNSGETSMKEL